MSGKSDRSPTIYDVARAAGVSRAAVSKVIRNAYGVSPQMRAKVEATITELGYRPRIAARSMRGSSYTIGFRVPDVRNSFFAKVLDGAIAALANTQYQVIVSPASPDDQGLRALEALVDRQVAGLVVISSHQTREELESLASSVPLVLLGRHDDEAAFDTVVDDDELGAKLAVEHLAGLGMRTIVHITPRRTGRDVVAGMPLAVRRAGYHRAMEDLGLEPQIIQVEESGATARAAALKLLQNATEPVGIFAAHDILALGVLQAVAELGMSPPQVSVVGYDNTDIAGHPLISLSSVEQYGGAMGEMCAALLMERIAGRRSARHEMFSPQLIVRESSVKSDP